MISYRKVGGLRWVFAGRFCFAFCLRRKRRERISLPVDLNDFKLGPPIVYYPRQVRPYLARSRYLARA